MAISNDYPIVLIRNLPYSVSTESLIELAGSYGPIYQVRISNSEETKGSAFAIYYDIGHANKAAKGLNGMNFQGRYLVSSLYGVDKSLLATEDMESRKLHLEFLKAQHHIA